MAASGLGCGSDSTTTPVLPAVDGGDGSTIDAPEDGASDAANDGLVEGNHDAGPSDPCGGCKTGSICDPAVGCADCAGASGCPDAVIYASPTGSGDACTFPSPCALTGARDKARSMSAAMANDILVYLRGGSYELSEPFVLTQLDSGRNGRDIVYRAYPNERPVLSGGTRVTTPWILADPGRNIYRTNVGAGARSRQLYVSDRRAIRARGTLKPSGWTETATGYTTTDPTVQSLSKPEELEVVGFRLWKSFRCRVQAIAGGTVIMRDPCWSAANSHSVPGGADYTIGLPEWVENAYELLDEEGEFHLDSATGALSYKPRDGEDMSSGAVHVVLPRLEKILDAEGTLDAPLEHVRFEGLTFAHATWLRPETDEGYACIQAGVTGPISGPHTRTPANVTFRAARNIRIQAGTFVHLGAAALSFDYGSQDNDIVGNRFEDVSGIALAIGDVTHAEDHHPTDLRAVVKNHHIRDNFVTQTGAEFFDSPGIWAGYVEGSLIEHNDLFFLPYTGISVGWGWGSADPPNQPTPSVCKNNRIERNRVSWHLRVLEDGGGIYVLGAQPGSDILGNHVHNQSNDYGALYLDNGTQYYTVTQNVVAHVPHWYLVQPFATKALNNTVTGNWHDEDNPFPTAPDPSNKISDNTMTGGNWPAESLAVIAASGLRAPWNDYHPNNVALGKATSSSSEYSVRIPTPLGHGFRRDLAADSGGTWTAFRSTRTAFRGTWPRIPDDLDSVPGHLARDSGALGQGELKTLTDG